VLDTVFGVCVVQTLCWRSFVRTLLGTQSLEFASWNQELHSFASKRTLVHLAANGSNEPIVTDAAERSGGNKGRIADLRCKCEISDSYMSRGKTRSSSISLHNCARFGFYDYFSYIHRKYATKIVTHIDLSVQSFDFLSLTRTQSL